jgi:hypothetical protein
MFNCAACRHDVTLSASFRARSEDAGFDDSVRTVVLCAGCVALLRTFRTVDVSGHVLAELARALEPEDADAISHDSSTAKPPERSGVPCDVCLTDDLPRWRFDSILGTDSVCIGCIDDGVPGLREKASLARTPLEKRLFARLSR